LDHLLDRIRRLRGWFTINESVFQKNSIFTGYNEYLAHFALWRVERNFAESFVSIVMSIVKSACVTFLALQNRTDAH
jgi:hypothetical protein